MGYGPEGSYCPDHNLIMFRSISPSPLVIAHEYAHFLHCYYGIPCDIEKCEAFADIFARAYVKGTRFDYPDGRAFLVTLFTALVTGIITGFVSPRVPLKEKIGSILACSALIGLLGGIAAW